MRSVHTRFENCKREVFYSGCILLPIQHILLSPSTLNPTATPTTRPRARTCLACCALALKAVYEEEQRGYYILSSFWAELDKDQVLGEPAVVRTFDMHTCTLEDVQARTTQGRPGFRFLACVSSFLSPLDDDAAVVNGVLRHGIVKSHTLKAS